ncbi:MULTISPECIES: hypothetical protein [unclassified Streptomyces]|uniref:hypothetical protein n=1 Tax=unclassified Streptomyces TaxID=2593676 RepID=UPI002E2B4AC1|nr:MULTISPECIES: hypothetical protein [unclassified Streptomyces]
MAFSQGQLAYWNQRLDAARTNPDRARTLWDLARTIAGTDDAVWADLVRLLGTWTEQQQGQANP